MVFLDHPGQFLSAKASRETIERVPENAPAPVHTRSFDCSLMQRSALSQTRLDEVDLEHFRDTERKTRGRFHVKLERASR
jgi:hypothetical protein